MNTQHGRLARQQARRRQRERLTGVLVAVLGVVVLVVAVVALQNPKGTATKAAASTSSAATSSSAAPSKSRSTSRAPSSSTASTRPSSSATTASGSRPQAVPLVVLNNSTTTGLARQAAQQFEAAGWSVTDTGNLTNDIISTCAYYDPSDGAALAAAEALQQQFPAIKRIKPKFAELPSGPIVVVLTSDFTLG